MDPLPEMPEYDDFYRSCKRLASIITATADRDLGPYWGLITVARRVREGTVRHAELTRWYPLADEAVRSHT